MNMSEQNSSSSAMNEPIEEGDERDDRHEQDSRQQSCSKTDQPELDSQALLSVLATMQANITQTNRFLARLFDPKQAGGEGGIRPQAGSSLCCAETVSSRKLKLSDFYYILIGWNSEYKPFP